MPDAPTDKLGEIPPGKAAIITHGAYEDIKDAIRASKPIAGKGLKSRQTDDGIVLDLEDQDGQDPAPWDGEVVGDEDGAVFQFTMPGKLYGAGMPENMFDGTELLSLVIADNPTFIILKGTADGNVPTSSEIIARSTPAAPVGIQEGTAPSTFETDLWVIVGTKALRVVGRFNLRAVAKEALRTDKADPACAEGAWIFHYTWDITETPEAD